jgi:hypothetical protein
MRTVKTPSIGRLNFEGICEKVKDGRQGEIIEGTLWEDGELLLDTRDKYSIGYRKVLRSVHLDQEYSIPQYSEPIRR